MIEAILFYVFATLAVLSAIGIVLSRNIVRMAVYLLITLVSVAGFYFLLGSELLAAVQVVVYAGGTLILIVFGIMLTSRSPNTHYEAKPTEVIVAMSAGIVLLTALITAYLWQVPQLDGPAPTGEYPVALFGKALLGTYLIPFEIASVLLLVVMIGAAYLAKAREKRGGE